MITKGAFAPNSRPFVPLAPKPAKPLAP
jgi:hypothetical protein